MIWAECYRLIAERMLGYRHRHEELADLLAEVLYNTGVSFPIADLGEELTGIDPFTFFAAFNRKMLSTSRQRLVEHVCCGLGTPFPGCIDFTGAPAIPSYKARFFSKRQSQHLEIEALWQLLEILASLDAQVVVSEERQQEIGAIVKDFAKQSPSHKDRLQWAIYWICPRHSQLLLTILGTSTYPNEEFNQALEEARRQELPTVDKQAFKALVENYAHNAEKCIGAHIKKCLTIKHFSESFNLDAGDFAAMLVDSLATDNSLLENTNNFYPYTEITRLVRLEPETVRDAFCGLFDDADNLPARCLRFCNAITVLHERYRDRFAHWQIKPCAHANFFVASIYLFMYDPNRYFLYSPLRAQRLSSALSYRETFRPTDADVVEAYAEMCNQLIDCLAEEPDLVAAAKGDIESRTGFVDTNNHLLLDAIIVSNFGI